jgi:DNA-binding transcriptional LysR family regulator
VATFLGRYPNPKVSVDELSADGIRAAEMYTIAPMLELVSRTKIGAIVAASAIPAQSSLCVVPLASPTPVRIPGILWKREAKHTKEMRAFMSIVRKLALVPDSARGRVSRARGSS